MFDKPLNENEKELYNFRSCNKKQTAWKLHRQRIKIKNQHKCVLLIFQNKITSKL